MEGVLQCIAGAVELVGCTGLETVRAHEALSYVLHAAADTGQGV
jgi:hypothetical protein